MPKVATYPQLFDSMKYISIAFLRKYGYFKPHIWMTGTVTFSSRGTVTGTICLCSEIHSDDPHILLSYSCNGVPLQYKVRLVKSPSNLGRGEVWFFLCPRTFKRCRKLYLGDTHFCHRSAFRGCMYDKQTLSKKYRWMENVVFPYFKTEELYEQLYKKHLKKKYAGKPTKKYARLTRQIKKRESVSHYDIEAALMG